MAVTIMTQEKTQQIESCIQRLEKLSVEFREQADKMLEIVDPTDEEEEMACEALIVAALAGRRDPDWLTRSMEVANEVLNQRLQIMTAAMEAAKAAGAKTVTPLASEGRPS
jgi:hypothetical protein